MIPDLRCDDDWRLLLRGTLARLDADLHAPKPLDVFEQLQSPDPGPDWDDDDDAVFEAEAAMAEAKNATDEAAATADGASPHPALPSPVARTSISTLRLHALARLCRTFGTPARLAALVRPGALTVISCADVALLEDLPEALRALLRSVTGLESCDAQKPDQSRGSYSLLTPRTARTTAAIPAREDVSRSLRSALAQPLPLIVLLSSTAQLDSGLRDLLPAPIPVRALDGAVLGALLDKTYAGDDAGGGRCPAGAGSGHDRQSTSLSLSIAADPELRRLPPEAIALILRHEDRASALAELQRLLTAATSERRITLDDVTGCGESERVARQLVRDLSAWSQGRIPWSSMTRSLLLHGRPGTGKTWLARAIAGSAGVPVVTGSFATWQAAGHLGHMQAEMQRSFAAAQAAAPCLLLLDEIDAAGSRDSPDPHAENYRRQVINGFLAEMDGMARREGVIVVAACNDVAALDPAIIRPGRFDRIVEVPHPGPKALRRIIEIHAAGAFDTGDLDRIIRDAVGCTPAEIDAAIREARSRARAADRSLTADDVRAVLGERHGGSPSHLHRVAVHECGHALVALALRRGRIVRIMAGPAGGEILLDRQPLDATLPELEDQLAFHLAGRAAENLVLGNPSAGAGGGPHSDLGRATRLALRIELSLGLGAESLLCHPDPDRAVAGDASVRFRVDRRLQRALQRARAILAPDAARLLTMADRLADARMLEGAELETILAGIDSTACGFKREEERELSQE